VTTEAAFIAALRTIATSPAARGLADDAAVLDFGGSCLALTMDAVVEGVHFLPQDPPETIAWKLVATNVSDLAAKGAVPRGCLLTYPLSMDEAWDTSFLSGLQAACDTFVIPLLGGDTVRQPPGTPRSFTLVALGEPASGVAVPSRSGAKAGDRLWVSAPIGDAGLGLAILRNERDAQPAHRAALVASYRSPRPNPELGAAIAPYVTAMMDVSDGLLIDSQRLAAASQISAVIDLDQIPLSMAFVTVTGDGPEARLFAASAGDDYCLLFTAPVEATAALQDTAAAHHTVLYPIGRIMDGRGLSLTWYGEAMPLPHRLGYEH